MYIHRFFQLGVVDFVCLALPFYLVTKLLRHVLPDVHLVTNLSMFYALYVRNMRHPQTSTAHDIEDTHVRNLVNFRVHNKFMIRLYIHQFFHLNKPPHRAELNI